MCCFIIERQLNIEYIRGGALFVLRKLGLEKMPNIMQTSERQLFRELINGHWVYSQFLAWAWLAKPKANFVIPKNQPLPKCLWKKRVKVRSSTCHYATKQRPVKITMYLGLDIIIKLKFTTNFDTSCKVTSLPVGF